MRERVGVRVRHSIRGSWSQCASLASSLGRIAVLLVAAFPILAATAPAAEPASPHHVQIIAGTGASKFSGDGGPATSAGFVEPFGVVRGPDGALWCVDYADHRVRRVDGSGIIRTEAGTGVAGYSGDGGPAREATLNHPHEIRFDAAGDLFIADTSSHVIRRVQRATRRIDTVAGTGQAGYSGDGGAGTNAAMNLPISLQFGPGGDLYIADIGNHCIRRLDSRTGILSTFAGTGRPGPTPDGAPIAGTPLTGPRSIDFDADGNLWLVTREGNQVLRIDRKDGRIRLVAGTGARGWSGDSGPARAATLSGPKGIAVAPDGSVLIADTENSAIRRIDPRSGTIHAVAGTGKAGEGPIGDPLTTLLRRPHGIFVDADGTILIGDSYNHRILSLGHR